MNESAFESKYREKILRHKLRQVSELIRDIEKFLEGKKNYMTYDEKLKANEDEINELYSKSAKIAQKYNFPWNNESDIDESKYPTDIVDFYDRSVPLMEELMFSIIE